MDIKVVIKEIEDLVEMFAKACDKNIEEMDWDKASNNAAMEVGARFALNIVKQYAKKEKSIN